MWSVARAKSHLSEILRRARAGEPQFIGTQEACVVLSAENYRRLIADRDHDGRWLTEQAARIGGDLVLPSRDADRAAVVFED